MRWGIQLVRNKFPSNIFGGGRVELYVKIKSLVVICVFFKAGRTNNVAGKAATIPSDSSSLPESYAARSSSVASMVGLTHSVKKVDLNISISTGLEFLAFVSVSEPLSEKFGRDSVMYKRTANMY